MAVVTNKYLKSTAAPNLPMPGPTFDKTYLDLLTNSLRLYFNQIDGLTNGLLKLDGGAGLSFPHIAASYNDNQYITTSPYNNTEQIVLFDTLESGSGFTLNPSGTATAAYSGVYKIDYSLQFANTANTAHDAIVWLKVNGAGNLARSASKFTLPARKSAGNPSYLIAYSSIVFEVQAGDEIALWWQTDQAYRVSPATDGVYMLYEAATGNYPAIPSAIGSIVFVSGTTT